MTARRIQGSKNESRERGVRVCSCVLCVLRFVIHSVKRAGNDFVLEYNKYTEWFHYEASSRLCVNVCEFVCVCGSKGFERCCAQKK